jgi:ADP-ribose pyrophosphatase YjhB (NUDIX family)
MITTDDKIVKLIADVALIHNNTVLLCKYKETNKYDHQSGWFIPDDMVRFNEHPSDAARRILTEQMSYITANLSLGFIESFIGNDGSWHLIFHYWQKVDALPEIMPTGEISEYKWFDRFTLPADSEIAHHGWAKATIEKIMSNLR